MGISQSPEGRRLFPRMTVFENLEMGAYQRTDKAGMREDMERVFTLFPRLAERKTQKAGTMSGGEQQMCAIGRALMARPKLLMLDEPSMGLAPIFVERIFETIVEVNKQGTTILLVEQNALMALDVANRGYVLETGRIALADDATLRENSRCARPISARTRQARLRTTAESRAARGGTRSRGSPPARPRHLERGADARGSGRTRVAARRRHRGSPRRGLRRAGRAQAGRSPSRRTAATDGRRVPPR